jgi:hypothetical protein
MGGFMKYATEGLRCRVIHMYGNNCIILNIMHQSSSSTVRNSSLYYTIHTTCFGLTYRPSSGVIYKQIHKGIKINIMPYKNINFCITLI